MNALFVKVDLRVSQTLVRNSSNPDIDNSNRKFVITTNLFIRAVFSIFLVYPEDEVYVRSRGIKTEFGQ